MGGEYPMAEAAPQPNWVQTFLDFLKTVVTLASGLLVLSVTFRKDIVGPDKDTLAEWLLAGCWLLLFGSILMALWTTARVVRALKNHQDTELGSVCRWGGNRAWVPLLLAVLLFGIVGVTRARRAECALAHYGKGMELKRRAMELQAGDHPLMLSRNGEFAAAASEFLAALHEDQSCVEARYALAWVYVDLGLEAEALQQFALVQKAGRLPEGRQPVARALAESAAHQIEVRTATAR